MACAPRPLAATLAAALLLAASACGGGDDSSTLTLTAQSSSGEAEVSYQLDNDARVTETVTTPWEQTVDVSGVFELDLGITNLGETGTVACGIEYAASSLSNPSATGQAAADCIVSGSSRGGTFTMSSSSFGTPFDDAAPDVAAPDDAAPDDDETDESGDETDDGATADGGVTADDGAADDGAADGDAADDDASDGEIADIPDGMSAALLFTDPDGNPIEPAQFDRVWVSIVVEGALGADDVQVLVEGEIDDGESVISLNDRERHDADDVDSNGRLVHVLRSFDLDQPGTLRAEFAGEVKIDDVVIPVDDRVEIDIAPTEVVVEARELSGGFVILDVASVAETLEDVPAQRSSAIADPEPVSVGDLRGIAGVGVGDSDVAVFQVVSSQSTTVEEVADVIEAFLSEAADVERSAAEIDGRETIRLTFEAAGSGTGDVLAIDGEIVFVQARWSTGTDAQTIRDSIRFDPSRLLPADE
ncbi:hypothetical protein [Ilumatobacter coccineus]|uniref:Uncharacterized protein n=1 Tax=Ilumatobacter coccineus (strain NBRC 103263 / KCTC 29153 / YM16-304) TaxID=1313172 RepID=A0A6C7ED53_ILUCY|nr:hypothetical protein [Ilumatobacter coccineus]BAN04290.1 hypothetical protein YM304_39760 [Ilumatobacter coccineus YM16-304]